jgi:uncharacterized membrane protein YbhN (UPF0104 family)
VSGGQRTALGILGGLVLFGGVAGIVGEVASFHAVGRALGRADAAWAVACLGAVLLAYVGYVAAYRGVARACGGPRLSCRTALHVVVMGLGAFVVGASAGALGTDWWALHAAGRSPRDAATRVLALNTLEWAVLATGAAVSALVLAVAGGAPAAFEFGWLVAVPACVAAAAVAAAPPVAARLAALQPRGGVLRPLATGLATAVDAVLFVRALLRRPRRHADALLGLPLYWAGELAALEAALHAFGAGLAPAPLVLAYATAYVLTMLPLPAGGAGGVEAALAFSLHALGVALAPALLATLLYRLVAVWLPLVPALLLLPRVPALRRELHGAVSP